MLLSVDWDYFSGCVEHVFDAPIWGTRDTAFDRLEAWQVRALKRNGDLSHDFPLFEDWSWLLQFSGIKTFATLSHADAYSLLERFHISSVVNLDSHHDLFSTSGDPNKLRAGNWAGLALEHRLIQSYKCIYPSWHAQVRVTEGYDLVRTRKEFPSQFALHNIRLERLPLLELEMGQIDFVLLVQSPAWTNPEHDDIFFKLCENLKAEFLEMPLRRGI